MGGSADAAASVKVYLTWNTAAAADVDVAKGTVSDAQERVPPAGGSPSPATAKGLKFPLTLSWAKGEVGEKVITIPVKVDKTVEDDGAFQLSKEEAGALAQRQYKFIQNLEAALVRIENKTYGICRVTGKLIPKERLRLVPHATTTVEGKAILEKSGKK